MRLKCLLTLLLPLLTVSCQPRRPSPTYPATPVEVDLPALWRKLGVKVNAGRVVYDEGAPLASIRRSITERTPEGASTR